MYVFLGLEIIGWVNSGFSWASWSRIFFAGDDDRYRNRLGIGRLGKRRILAM